MFTSSIFGQLLKQIPRDEFAKLVARHRSDRWRKSFRTWDHLVAMLAGQLGAVRSLRDLETVCNSHDTQRYHLGCTTVKRSTLSDANKHRDSGVFRDLALSMLSGSRRDVGELKTVISVVDSSLIRLSGRGSDWAAATRTRTYNHGLKLHVQFAPQAEQIEFAQVTDSNVNDITVGRELALEAGRIYVFDKGYCDYNWWSSIAGASATFVTRLKANAAFETIEQRTIPAELVEAIVSDQVIRLSNAHPRGGKTNKLAGVPLRLIRIPHPGGKAKPFCIVSNDLSASADDIAGWYKQRWGIELVFKWLKQNLQISSFLGESRNAIMIQIYVAIIAYMLLKRFHQMVATHHHMRLKDILVYVTNHLFSRPKTELWRRRRRHEQVQIQPELWPDLC